MFINNETFNHMFKRGHTNLSSFVIGLGLGLLVYHWQSAEHKFQNSTIRRFMIWMTFPGIIALSFLGGLFYRDAPRASIYIRMVYTAFLKPAFSGVVAFLIIGIMFKFKDLYRGILEWPGWALPSRLSQCAYIVHVLIIKLLTGTGTTPIHVSLLHMIEIMTSTIAISFMTAIFLYLMVEAPTLQLIKLCNSGNSGDENFNYTINNTISIIGNITKNAWQQDMNYAKPNNLSPNKEMKEISKNKEEEGKTKQKETKFGNTKQSRTIINQESTVIEIKDNEVVSDDEKKINVENKEQLR
ncbi:hypothetical protein O0L34_g8037 [Tuta absoluta]|nr:hypothetical protein O0L34_g8037 [Tuta absoluta]